MEIDLPQSDGQIERVTPQFSASRSQVARVSSLFRHPLRASPDYPLALCKTSSVLRYWASVEDEGKVAFWI